MNLLKMILIASLTLAQPAFSKKHAGLNWFDGKVEDAFVKAKKENKPLFLYWGAVWCPPCNVIKKTIFTQKKFQAKMKSFIPVYLDGDDERAQTWGTKLNAKGYPTMLILDPNGKEIMRMPMGIDVDQYTALLDKSLESLVSIADLLKKKKLTPSEWQLLAFHSWDQDYDNLQDDNKRVNAFKKFYNQIPKSLKKERFVFLMRYLSSLSRLEKKPAFNSAMLRKDLLESLSDDSIAYANKEVLFWNLKPFVNLLYKNKKEAGALIALWRGRAESIINNKELFVDERLSALAPLIDIEKMKSAKKADYSPSKTMQARVLKMSRTADAEAKTHFERQSSIPTAIWLLTQTKQYDEAKKLTMKEIKSSDEPYYFMRYMAKIEGKLGNKTEELSWHKKAWHKARGHASRFQWGTNYINSLIEITPKDNKTYMTSFKTVFSELVKSQDAFDGRNAKRLQSIQKALKKWEQKEKETLNNLSKFVKDACKTHPFKSKCDKWVRETF